MKEICLSFEVRIRVTRTDVNWLEAVWLEAVLLAERERCFQEAICTVLREVEGWARAALGPSAACGGAWRPNGRKRRALGTLLGTVAYWAAGHVRRGGIIVRTASCLLLL